MSRLDSVPAPASAVQSPTASFIAADGVRMLPLDDETVVFNPLSWDAHLLNAAAAAVLDLLTRGPRSAGDVESFLREAMIEPERKDAAQHARRLLAQLQELGLIRLQPESPRAGV